MRYIIMAVLAVGIVALIMLAPKKEQTPEDKATEAVKGWVLTNLDDPDSYKAGKFVIDKNGSGWDVDHDFRAKNKFGALVQDHVSVYVDSTYHVVPPR